MRLNSAFILIPMLLVIGDAASHDPVPCCAKAIEIAGRKTGAFEAAVTGGGAWLEPGRTGGFDAVLINNWRSFNPLLPGRSPCS